MSSEPTVQQLGVILEQLRATIRERRFIQGTSELSAVEQDVRRSLDEIELHRVISAHWPLKARNPIERLINLLNKLVRRLLRWYINPIVEQQNAYNDAVARTLRLLADAYTELAEQTRDPRTSEPPHQEPRTENQEPRTKPALSVAEGNQELPTGSQAHTFQHSNIPTLQRAVIQQLIEQRGQLEPPARFVELELAAQEQRLDLHQRVNAHWPLVGATLVDRAVAFAQTAIRRYLRWLINPIVEQQNNANAAMSSALHDMVRLDADRRAEVALLRATRHNE